MYKKYKSLNEIVKLAINALILGLIWVIFYKYFRHSEGISSIYETGSNWFTAFLLNASSGVLELFGYETIINGKYMKIVNSPGIFLDRGCLARNLMGLFFGFMLAYPGIIRKKLWYIPFGLIVINIFNIIRLSALAWLTLAHPDLVEVNHHYVFKIIVFSAILLMWYFWIFKINVATIPKAKTDS